MLRRRGISEVIAAMLLILIAVAASVLLYVYASGLMGRLQGAAQNQPYLDQISLDYYDWTTLTALKLTLRNVGASKVNLATGSADYFVNGAILTPSTNTCTSLQIPQSTCQVTLPAIGTSGIAYNVKIGTKDGAVFSYSCIAGQAA
jgi:archaeal type IV pilus assembly protein PilA